MKRIILGLATVGALAVTAFSAQNDNAAAPRGMSQAQMQSMQMMQACPVKVDGTTVAATDTADGVAVTFTAKPANVADLQSRVEHMAAMHNTMTSATGTHAHMMDGTVKYEALPTGARLLFTPKEASRLKEFREQVRSRVEQMKKGDCSMMQEMMMQNMQMMGGAGKKTDAK